MKEEIIVISVGGSMIVPEEIDISWMKEFRSLIESYINEGKRFILIAGGGKTCRKYQNALRELGNTNQEELDKLGIEVTKVNASLLKSMFKNKSYKEVINNPTKKINFKEKVLVASGWKPGHSTDMDAVLFAGKFKVRKVINLSNIDYAYDKDPKKFPDAKRIEEISWKDFRKIVGDKWSPGLNAPFDPIASKEAEKLGIEVAIMNGKNIENLKRYIEGESFIGTRIKS